MECENQHQKISFSSEICPLCATYDLVQEIRGNISELYTNLEALEAISTQEVSNVQ